MVLGFTSLLACQLVGEVAVRSLGLPVPGPVLGMLLLVACLAGFDRRHPDDGRFEKLDVTRVGDGLLANLSLLFVPAGVGLIEQFGTLKAQGLAIGAAVAVSTPLTLLVTVLAFTGTKRWMRRGAAEPVA